MSDEQPREKRRWPYITAREIVKDFKDLPVDISECEFVDSDTYDRLKAKYDELRVQVEQNQNLLARILNVIGITAADLEEMKKCTSTPMG